MVKSKMINWIKKNRVEFAIFLLILLVAGFMRFYRISEYMTFLGDEGRDALAVKDIVLGNHFPLLGPPTSIGNMYLGPLYYYMMAVPMFIFWLNPVAPAGMDALIGLLTIGLIYYLARIWFGRLSAMISAFLYAISPVNIFYSRSSWNPNPAPFFSLVAILSFYKAVEKNDYRLFIITGIALAFDLQMHYLALILVPVIFLFWLNEIYRSKKLKIKKRYFGIGTLFGILAFLMLMSPLVIFDLHHNFMNFKAITAFFTDRQTTINLNIFNTISRVIPIYSYNLIQRYITGDNFFSIVISILVLVPLIKSVIGKLKGQVISWPYFSLGVWLIVGVLGLALYKQTIYDHYLGFLNPVPYFLLGSIFNRVYLPKKTLQKRILIFGVTSLTLVLIFLNLQRLPLLDPPHNQLKRTQDVANIIIEQAQGKPFNFALLSAHNYDAAYQYYFEIYNHKPDKVPFVIDTQLFVACEDQVCTPINNPKYEIAAFGWSKIESEKDFEGIKIYKLVHNNPTSKK